MLEVVLLSLTIHKIMNTEHGLCNVTGEIMLNTLLNHWIKYNGKPNIVRTDTELLMLFLYVISIV